MLCMPRAAGETKLDRKLNAIQRECTPSHATTPLSSTPCHAEATGLIARRPRTPMRAIGIAHVTEGHKSTKTKRFIHLEMILWLTESFPKAPPVIPHHLQSHSLWRGCSLVRRRRENCTSPQLCRQCAMAVHGVEDRAVPLSSAWNPPKLSLFKGVDIAGVGSAAQRAIGPV